MFLQELFLLERFDSVCFCALMDTMIFSLLQWCLSQTINQFDDVKFEAASVLAELHDQQQQSNLSKPILRKAIELSQHSIYWHCRLIFQLAVSEEQSIINVSCSA